MGRKKELEEQCGGIKQFLVIGLKQVCAKKRYDYVSGVHLPWNDGVSLRAEYQHHHKMTGLPSDQLQDAAATCNIEKQWNIPELF